MAEPGEREAASGETIRNGLLRTLVWRDGGHWLQIVFSAALARLLALAEFGIIAMLLVGGFAQLLADTGLTTALIYKRVLTEADVCSGLWIRLAISAALAVLFVLGAAPLAAFDHQPALRSLTSATSLVFIAQALEQVRLTMIRRALRTRLLSLIGIASVAVSGATAVAMVAAGYGVWALFWQMLLQVDVSSALAMLYFAWRPQLVFSRAAARELSGYGGYLLGHSALNYWLRNGDNLLNGRVLGVDALGLYSRAYSPCSCRSTITAAPSGR